MKLSMTRSSLPLVFLFLALSAGLASAAEPVAEVRLHPDGLVLTPVVDAAGFVLTVSTPDGIVIRRAFGPRDTVSFSLAELQGELLDGVYGYQLDMQPILSAEQRKLLERVRQIGDDARAQIAGRLPSPAPSQSGYFSVYQGSIVSESLERPEEPPSLAGGPDRASSGGLQSLPEKTVISGDLTVYNSLCVGFDCASAETYGFDTIRLKENNLRIHFEDTSSGSFPTNDWRILANSTASGGASFLAVEDSTAARQVFTIEAGAASNSLYVDTGTRVGIGTSTPVTTLHTVTGNTPTLRLEQNSSSGFAAQSWDVAGNETNFFVRDVTSGSRLPFRIRPGAPTSSIDIAASGNVGVGTSSPSNSLHVRRSDGTAKVLVEEASTTAANRVLLELRNNGGVGMEFNNSSTGVVWNTRNIAGNFQIRENSDTTNEFVLDASGNLTLSGTITVPGGTLPDYVFEADYPLLPLDDLAAFIAEHKHLPNIPSAQAVHEAGKLDLTDFQRRLLEKIEELTLYTLDQQQTIQQLQQRLSAVEAVEAVTP